MSVPQNEIAPEDGAVIKLLRYLGNNEKYQLTMYLLDQYRGTSVSCRYRIPPRLENLDAQTELVSEVQGAIARMVLKHPVLQVGIVDADSKTPRWVQLDSIRLSHHIEWKFLDSPVDFEESSRLVTISQLDATYTDLDRCPGWKIVVLHQRETNLLEVLFTWNHPHADGMSGKIFHQDLLRCLNNTGGDEIELQLHEDALKLPQSPLRLPPPIEQATKLPITLGFAMKTLWQEFRPPILCRGTAQATWAPIHTSPYKTQLRVFTVENDILVKILSACRQHKTTLTGLMHGLMLVSLASRLEAKVAPAFQSITALNLRPYVPSSPPGYPWLEPERTMGNYVTIMPHEFDEALVTNIRLELPPKTTAGECLTANLMNQIWSAAADVRRGIERKQELGVKNDNVGLMKFVGDWQQQMSDTARRPRQNSWFITNLGVLDGKPKLDEATSSGGQDGTWSVRRAQFSTSAETTSAALIISPMTVAGEHLCVVGTWQDCIFDVRLGEQVMADLEKWLIEIGSQAS
ncbi:alcohol acetyltransferase-domain-containing protein [Biscogniauxia marginata]|nr:alcohol acetyltransferase-domain-containing protein [Biscogniauxia marginata]